MKSVNLNLSGRFIFPYINLFWWFFDVCFILFLPISMLAT